MTNPVIIGTATLILGDCMAVLRDAPDKCWELSLVDPPYGIGAAADKRGGKSRGGNAVGGDYDAKEWDALPPDKAWFVELQRVSKNQIIWGANHFMQNIWLGSPCWIVWDKMNGDSFYADAELAYTSFNTAVRIFKFKWHGMLQGDMKNKEQRIHPTQKPIALYLWLLQNYAKPGDRILDTHGGSGSSVIACLKMGYEITWIEKDEDYFNAAVQRIRDSQRQQPLFTPEPHKPVQEGLI